MTNQNAKGKRQKAKSKRQKAKGKKQKATPNDLRITEKKPPAQKGTGRKGKWGRGERG
jgi:hypothetical protein